MRYQNIEQGFFQKRLNRFSAIVTLSGREELVHVKNTGRLGELLLPDKPVYLQRCADFSKRKTKWDLIAVESDGQIVNIDSQAPNRVFNEFLQSGAFRKDIRRVRPEVFYGDSRFDFQLELKHAVQWIEVKGVTLLRDDAAYFPDAPTERGIKHIHGLIHAVAEGYEAALVFVIQMKRARVLRPNDQTQTAFGEALREAAKAGVQILAYDCVVTGDGLIVDAPVPVEL